METDCRLTGKLQTDGQTDRQTDRQTLRTDFVALEEES